MKAYFLDTSATLKRYLQEVGSDAVDGLFREDRTRYVSSLGLLEAFASLQRLKAVDGLLTEDQLRLLQAEVSADIESGRMVVVNPTAAEIEAAVRLLSGRYLTAVDAMQIAVAQSLGSEVVFVCSDAKLNRLAEEQQLTVLDPAAGPLPGAF